MNKMNKIALIGNVRLTLTFVAALAVSSGCSTWQSNSGGAKSGVSYPQTSKTIIVDPAYPPPDVNATVNSTYDDATWGKTEVRSDDYLRHIDTASPTGWTPWHYRKAPHIWGDAPAPTAKTSAPVADRPAPGLMHNAVAFPTGVRESSVLLVERIAPAEVTVGQPFEYDIKVTNIGKLALANVGIADRCAANFKLDSSTPAASKSADGLLRWPLGTLEPSESKTIKVRGSASELGAMTNCVAADYDQSACMAINVIQPKLKLEMSAPAEILACDPLPVKYTVTNTGTGAARNVVISHQLPANVTTEDGHVAIEAKVDQLDAGQSRAFTSNLKAKSAGKIDTASTATADPSLRADAKVSTIVRAPHLTIKKTGTAQVFIGRPAAYQIVVTNDGDGEARNTIVEDQIPAGTKVVSATEGTVAQGDRLVWQVGTLKPNDTRTFAVKVQPAATAGTLVNTSYAKAYCAESVMAKAETAVKGIPAILLEMVDDPDPIEVGTDVVYTITITNQGSATDSNIKIVGTFEDQMQYISSSGDTTGTLDGKTLTFAPLPSLAPKAKAVWKVKVKAIQAGDVRFHVELTTDQLTRPVIKTESTNFYK